MGSSPHWSNLKQKIRPNFCPAVVGPAGPVAVTALPKKKKYIELNSSERPTAADHLAETHTGSCKTICVQALEEGQKRDVKKKSTLSVYISFNKLHF